MSELLDVIERIKYIIEHEGHTIATFARKCGVPDGTIRNLLARGTKPGYDLTVAIIKAVNQPWCDANWLVMGKEHVAPVPEDTDTKKLLKIIEEQQKTINDLQRQNAKLTDKLLGTDK